jgi:hypothetical protein
MKTRKRRGTKRRMKGGILSYLRDLYSRRQQRSVYQQYAFSRPQISCQNSGECLLFGEEGEQLLSFFNNFNLDMNQYEANTTITLTKLPVNSANGLVAEVKFSKEGFDAFALLKTPLKINADNLWYEYLIGLKVNPWSLIFPSLTMTFGLYADIPLSDYREGKPTPFKFKGKVVANSLDVTQSCLEENRQHLCLLTQYFENTVSLHRHREKKHPDLWYMYFQIYYTLYYLGKLRFIHNDLRANNVLVVHLPKPMKFVYDMVLMDGNKFQFSFYSQELVKIIDYGRSKVAVLTNEEVKTRKEALFNIAENAAMQHFHEKDEEYAYVRKKIRPDDMFELFIEGGRDLLAELLEEIDDSDSSEILNSLCKEDKCSDDVILFDYLQRAKKEYQDYLKWKKTLSYNERMNFQENEKIFLQNKKYLSFVKPYLDYFGKLHDVMTGVNRDSVGVNAIKEYKSINGWGGHDPVITSSCGNYIGYNMANLYVKGKDFFHTERNKRLIDDKDLLQSELRTRENIRENPLYEVFDLCYEEAKELNMDRDVPEELYGTLYVKGPTMEPMIFTKA